MTTKGLIIRNERLSWSCRNQEKKINDYFHLKNLNKKKLLRILVKLAFTMCEFIKYFEQMSVIIQ
jgi:hypothetical protein